MKQNLKYDTFDLGLSCKPHVFTKKKLKSDRWFNPWYIINLFRYVPTYRPVVTGGAGGVDFGISVNPISTKLCPPNNNGTPGFSDLPTAMP